MSKQKYLVTAPVGYLGYQPGDTFEAELDEDEEQRAIAAGWIEPANKTSKQKGDESGA